ncbi:MAG: nucleotide exchange factor GrpE [Planctomycetes bacterium]|nr:nucleotide exchange factor GrpE [Planctomycetota bacterium]
MLQKCAILGLVFLLAGGAAYGWLHREAQEEYRRAESLVPTDALEAQNYFEKYGRWYQLSPEQQNQLVLELDNERKSKTALQLDQEQQARLRADLDKLAAGQMHPGDIADFLYGRGWESRVEQYKRHKEQMETARTVAMTCLSIGGVLFGGCAILWFLSLLGRGIRAVFRRSSEPAAQTDPSAAELTDIELHEESAETVVAAPEPEEPPRQRRKVLARSETSGESDPKPLAGLDDLFHVISSGTGAGAAEPAWPAPRTGPAAPVLHAAMDDVAVLLTDAPASGDGWSAGAQWSWNGTPEPAANRPQEQHPMKRSTVRPPEEDRAAAVESTLKVHTEDLQKQIAEFKQVAQNVQQATREQSAPLSNTLKELTEQVSAIREYAASQQHRVEKLQDGYDWGIIRTFCLRVIRCVDNLEGRLADLPREDGAISHLEEIKNELLFALESSGVEQFRPDVNSEFHGQEKTAEALKDKQPAKKPEQVGKIARVIRPGYRYLIDDENYRVVRMAQVKVYG